ncbi:AraC family transcriptional regulator [Streptomyces alfalfae]|uniref:GlxA family transcriptional regulator n=1 Tax=Streptomyces alfalfae TaxID=1642299 RepID=UPI0009A22C1B|nr:helix-turn-helix domain-containing protein [Streptomyces alfalfae]AYA18146.1 helix-turn-helix domain-containing protein [Streptomyces fradiae]QUI32300.1 helix-turn-helix domain-containing protein [Streptomyces alfalfae]RXX40263.1 AraC family transcriptional regulator [Streptomyces alfalfae]RZM87045.1 helix-turn-helix domain-containing protein [Streptomyces alfalfae]
MAAQEAQSTATPRRHRVVVLALDGVIPFELGIPQRIFGRARDAGGRRLYEVVTCGVRGPGAVRTDADFDITVTHGPEALATADTVVVPASYELGPVYEEGRLTDELTAALSRLNPAARLVAICTGGYVLAAAGFLDGRPATTHWSSADHFQALFPQVEVDADVLFIDDGDVLTSAGVAAGVDLCLHLVRRDHGSAVAGEVARRTVVPPHRDGGQAQYIRRPVPEPQLATTREARAWALGRLDQPLQLRDLAEREAMSVRTFTRRFREEVGMSPGQWLTQQRVERARHLLESSDLSVDQVARDAGFGTAQSMRQHLQAALGVTPTAYRRTFREPPATPPGACPPSASSTPRKNLSHPPVHNSAAESAS